MQRRLFEVLLVPGPHQIFVLLQDPSGNVGPALPDGDVQWVGVGPQPDKLLDHTVFAEANGVMHRRARAQVPRVQCAASRRHKLQNGRAFGDGCPMGWAHGSLAGGACVGTE